MSGIISNWKLTLDPASTAVVLVNIGDKLVDEIEWGMSREVLVEPLVRSDTPFLDDGGNASVSIGYARYDDSDTDALSRQALLAAMLTAFATDPKILKIEVSGVTDRYWQFSAALVTSYKPGRYLNSSRSRRITSCNLLAAGMTQVGP